MIAFSVSGIPKPKGSMRLSRQGKIIPGDSKLKWWSKAVAFAAHATTKTKLSGPVSVSLRFRFVRPRNTKFTEAPYGKPDLDKLVRAVFDALTSHCFEDDAQVCKVFSEKVWASKPGVDVEVIPLVRGAS